MSEYGLHRRLSYEQMLSSRYALQNSPAHGREWTLDRSATVLLSRLEVQGPMSVGELAEAFGLDISTIHRQVAAAMKAGLIERIPDPDGGQARKHRSTAEGVRRLHLELENRDELSRLVTADWTEDELGAFVALMSKFNRKLETLRNQQWPRPYPTDGED